MLIKTISYCDIHEKMNWKYAHSVKPYIVFIKTKTILETHNRDDKIQHVYTGTDPGRPIQPPCGFSVW